MIRSRDCTFYCCYLLQSVPKPGSFYIGSTPDPYRRLRQHNGELTQGAKRTKAQVHRPWRMICIVSGFQSRISALQFEHAWQHAYQTRHIPPEQRISAKKSSNRGIDKHVGNIRLLANSSAFKTSPLVVHLFEKSAHDTWDKNKFDIECGVKLERDVRTCSSEAIGGGGLSQYFIPGKKKQLPYGVQSDELTAICPHCNYTTPLTTLASLFIKPDELVPTGGECPDCNHHLDWHEIASNARRLKYQYVSESESES